MAHDTLHFWYDEVRGVMGNTMHPDDAANSVARGKGTMHTDASGHSVVVSVKINDAARAYIIENAPRYWQARDDAYAKTDADEQYKARGALREVIIQIAREAEKLNRAKR